MAKSKKRSDGLYQKSLVVGRKPDGHYIRKTLYAKTKKELDQKVSELTQQLNSGLQVWENGLSFAELAEIWFEQYNPDAAEPWRYNQWSVVQNHLLPSLGEMKIRDIRQLHLQTIITSMSKKGFATGTMKNVKQIAVRIMRVAVGSDLIMRNPFLEVKVPVKDPEVRRALTEFEISLITNTWDGHNLGPMAMIMLYAGLRRGEAAALEWTDIDFENRIIKVTKSCSMLKNKNIVKKPKTKAGTRDVPIPNVLLSVLQRTRKPAGYVCTCANGAQLTESSYASQWKSYQNYLNIKAGGQNGAGPHIHRIDVIDNITAHMLRHTYATMLFDANVDVKSAQKFLGHSDIEVTLSIYTHLTKYKEEKAVNALNSHLDEMLESKCYASNVVPLQQIHS